jgi:DNA-binding protein HU-beta
VSDARRDLNKQEFIDEVAAKSGLSSKDAAKAVNAFLDSIMDTLKAGGEVAFTGFGKFTTQRHAERQGVNPRNPSEKVTIPAATVPKFTAGTSLKNQVRRVQIVASDSEGEPDEPWRKPPRP